MQSFREEDLPALALDTMRKNKALMARVAKATGFSAKKLATLADLSSKKGVSMYGAAANDFKSEGVDDAIPFMGYRAKEMTTSANSAVDIAKDDLPLEVAIIQGYRDVMDAGDGAGYNRDNLGTLMKGTRYCFEETFKRVELSGMRGTDRLNVAIRVSDTLKVSAGRMVTSKLTTEEINDVMEATTLLFTEAVEEAAGPTSNGSKANEILAAVGRVSDHVTGTVDEEMNKSSNGEETVIALLANGSGTGRKSSAAASEPEKEDEKTPDTKREEGGANGGEAGNAAGAAGNKSAGNASNGGSSKGGATKQELAAAAAAIVATDASTGIVALADGTLFDPTYYAAANPDVVAQYGTSTNALLAEWLKEGKAQGRPPIAPPKQTASNPPSEHSAGSGSDDDDDDDSSSSSGGSGGGGGGTPQVDGNGNFTLGGIQYNYDDTGNVPTLTMTGNIGNVSLPVQFKDSNGTVVNMDTVSRTVGGNTVTKTVSSTSSTGVTYNINNGSEDYQSMAKTSLGDEKYYDGYSSPRYVDPTTGDVAEGGTVDSSGNVTLTNGSKGYVNNNNKVVINRINTSDTTPSEYPYDSAHQLTYDNSRIDWNASAVGTSFRSSQKVPGGSDTIVRKKTGTDSYYYKASGPSYNPAVEYNDIDLAQFNSLLP